MGEPNWLKVLEDPNVKLHLYGKTEPRRGRKMGHLTMIGTDIREILDSAEHIKKFLRQGIS
jgi:5-(carboxyamino)imidazole ribonucleotide synthase